ncbi:MAG: sulfurtransferase TusA family protein [Chloroflexi bacterium]|nr:sulfurtransferase TusA family protein [Chloroflexota bacterium]
MTTDASLEALRARVAQAVDLRGQICPYTLMETRDALKELTQGQVLEVICDYEPAAKTTIPSFCTKKGYPLETVEEEASVWRLYIEKTD